ncbi:hypothetical protein ACOSP7_009321 [Xanthoceras sorbifolium]
MPQGTPSSYRSPIIQFSGNTTVAASPPSDDDLMLPWFSASNGNFFFFFIWLAKPMENGGNWGPSSNTGPSNNRSFLN